MTRRFFAALSGFLAALCVTLLLLSVLLEGCGTGAALMTQMFLRHAPAEETGLPEEAYPDMAAMITGYLSGDVDTFQYTLMGADGTAHPLFHDYEQQHMADCRALFVLERQVMLLSLCGLVALTAALLLLRRGRAAARGFAAGAGLVLLAVVALGVWGCVDFTGLFLLFHRLSFDNRLWMLNPATDLLIRLMPQSFFIHYAAVIGVLWGAGLLLSLGISLWLGWRKSVHQGERP